MDKLGRKLAISLALGFLVFAGLSLYADLPQMGQALVRFDWRLLPVIFGLTLVNYLLRFVKWTYYLRRLGVRGVPWWESFLIFFAGLSMVVTPGKVGEWLKCYLLRQVSGTPFSRTAPIILAERLTDGLALAILAGAGLFLYRIGWEILLVATLAGLALIALSRWRRAMEAILDWGESRPVVGPRVHLLRNFYESTYELFSPLNLAVAVSLGVVSWAGECVAYFFVLTGLGVEPSFELLIQATFILASSTIAGAALMTPGGLGVAEGGLVGLSQVLVGVTRPVAASSAILIRLGTLWLGVGVGVIALLILTRRLGRTMPLGAVDGPDEVDLTVGDRGVSPGLPGRSRGTIR